MFIFGKCYLYIVVFLSFTFPLFSLEKDRLVTFLKEYNASQEKYSGKIAYAIERGYPDVAEFFILKGEDIYGYSETIPNLSNTGEYRLFKHPLITAIRKEYNEAAILMIQLGFWDKAEEYKIEYVRKDFSNNTIRTYMTEMDRKNAMFVAIEENSYEIVLSLIDNGFDVNNDKIFIQKITGQFFDDRSICMTPLFQAIATKRFNIATLLLDFGADVEKTSKSPYLYENINGYQYLFNGSSLLKAVDDNYLDGVLLLLRYGANPLKGSPSPLERAIQKEFVDIVDMLFDAASTSTN